MSKYEIVTIKRSVINKNNRLIFLGKNGNQLTVEEVALEYYQSEEGGRWDGFWYENINFFLQGAMDKHFWNTFLNYLTKKDILKSTTEVLCKLIENKIKEDYSRDLSTIQDRLGTLKTIKQNWDTFEDDKGRIIRKYNCYFQEILEYVPIVIKSLTKKQLINITSRASYDSSRRGVPDLFLFRKSKTCIDRKFVEVKSQRDRLSEYQLGWIKFLLDNSFNLRQMSSIYIGHFVIIYG